MLVFLTTLVVALAQLDYGLQIDAGSTGSRVYIYKWPSRDLSTNASFSWIPPLTQPVSQASWALRTSTALSSYANNVSGVGAHIDEMLNFARPILVGAGANISDTPIFLGATAGMRTLPLAQRNSVMAAVRTKLRSSGFVFEDSYAVILSGEEEGVFGWLAVNYIKDTVFSTTTTGSLDLGGASTQITFVPETDVLSNAYSLSLKGVSIKTYTHSYLYFGWNTIFKRLNDAIAAANSSDSPCFNTGYNYVYSSTVNFTGSSNFAGCVNYMIGLLGVNEPCYADNCGLTGNYQPLIPPTMPFVAFSTFSIVMNTVIPNNTSPSMDQIAAAGAELCSINYTVVLSRGFLPQFASQYCAQMAYIHTLLTRGYGFANSSTQVAFLQKANGPAFNQTNVEWPLGGILNNANLLPWSPSPTNCTPVACTATNCTPVACIAPNATNATNCTPVACTPTNCSVISGFNQLQPSLTILSLLAVVLHVVFQYN